eukprot:9556-Heterococcus_DN1.PRE.1
MGRSSLNVVGVILLLLTATAAYLSGEDLHTSNDLNRADLQSQSGHRSSELAPHHHHHGRKRRATPGLHLQTRESEQEGSLRERKPTDIKSALTASYESEHDDKEPEEHCLE